MVTADRWRHARLAGALQLIALWKILQPRKNPMKKLRVCNVRANLDLLVTLKDGT